ncbi:hypothetical protein D5F51_19610 [Yersinia hibernica]|uniref:Uncharacterized protein n=1 Tax=Yersinia hibernica TaxID=2339259 RepID=A0ABX5R598_9GAMM|nr:hypothetical protein D5F51_19610 [Yersinia hibernica]
MSELQANLAFRQGLTYNSINVFPSSFKLHRCWLFAFTPMTYSCKFRDSPLAALLQLEFFWVIAASKQMLVH